MKLCPVCRQSHHLNATQCLCGHVFRTVFGPTPAAANAQFVVPPPPIVVHQPGWFKRHRAITVVGCVALCVLGPIWLLVAGQNAKKAAAERHQYEMVYEQKNLEVLRNGPWDTPSIRANTTLQQVAEKLKYVQLRAQVRQLLGSPDRAIPWRAGDMNGTQECYIFKDGELDFGYSANDVLRDMKAFPD